MGKTSFRLLISQHGHCRVACPPNASVKLLTYADDTPLVSLVSNGDESKYNGKVDLLVAWCCRNNLEVNEVKTVGMVVDCRKCTHPPSLPLNIDGSAVSTAKSFKFHLHKLKWKDIITAVTIFQKTPLWQTV